MIEPMAAARLDHACEGARESGRIGWSLHRALRRHAVAWGIAGGVGLLGIYFAIVALANSPAHAAQEFLYLWYWMVPLVLGFAVQVGLFAYARRATQHGTGAHARGVAASGGTSALSMIACCAHHVTDILPVIGLAGAAMLLATYQGVFLLLGVLSNVVGLVYVAGILRRHGLYPKRRSALSVVLAWPVDRALLPTLGLAGTVLALALLLTAA